LITIKLSNIAYRFKANTKILIKYPNKNNAKNIILIYINYSLKLL